MIACRDTDVRVALALGWRWQRTPAGSHLLCPPGAGDQPSSYQPERGGLQLVPAYSSEINAWEEYVTALRKDKRLRTQVNGCRACVFVDDRPFDASTIPLALCRMVLEHEEREADERQGEHVERGGGRAAFGRRSSAAAPTTQR